MRLLIFLLTATLSSFALGDQNTIRACFTEWPPYSYIKNDKVTGFSIEIYNAVIKESGLNISYTVRPWARCLHEFSNGNIDALVDGGTLVPNSLNAKKRPVLWILLFWVHNDSPLQNHQGYSQFDGKVVGYVRKYGYPQEFFNYEGISGRKIVNNDLQGLKMLDRKRYHAFFGDLFSNTKIVKEHGFNVRSLMPSVQTRYLTLSFSKNLKVQHELFEDALTKMYTSGQIDKSTKIT